jgi:hypothetical protein
MMEHLQKEVIRKFPTATYVAVAGFIFLRFFCPAISAPDAQEVVQASQLTPQARRTLVLISKVIQVAVKTYFKLTNLVFSKRCQIRTKRSVHDPMQQLYRSESGTVQHLLG